MGRANESLAGDQNLSCGRASMMMAVSVAVLASSITWMLPVSRAAGVGDALSKPCNPCG
jgi:hypothetical protein